jgi:hypothetical protein
MSPRSEALQSFIEASYPAFEAVARGPEARRTVQEAFAALRTPAGVAAPEPGSRLPVCTLLDEALAVALAAPPLVRVVDRFRNIEPSLAWKRRPDPYVNASPNFADGHANAMIVGPGGLEDRRDVWLGVTLMAPDVRYPDHDHPPEEVYLVLSEGEWRQGSAPWFTPGIGGSLYNEPGITHAMRSSTVPLFAFWVLRA